MFKLCYVNKAGEGRIDILDTSRQLIDCLFILNRNKASYFVLMRLPNGNYADFIPLS